MTRQMPYEPLPASVLFARLVSPWLISSTELPRLSVVSESQ